jgi:hypothetical protein
MANHLQKAAHLLRALSIRKMRQCRQLRQIFSINAGLLPSAWHSKAAEMSLTMVDLS